VKLLIDQDWTICWQETGEIQEQDQASTNLR